MVKFVREKKVEADNANFWIEVVICLTAAFILSLVLKVMFKLIVGN